MARSPNVSHRRPAHVRRLLWWGLTSSLFFVMAPAGALWGYSQAYATRIVPGVSIGGIAVGGKTLDEAREILASYQSFLEKDGLVVTYGEKTLTLHPTILSANGIALTELVIIDPDATLAHAFQIGHRGGATEWIGDLGLSLSTGSQIPLDASIDEASLLPLLEDSFQQFENPALDARPVLDEANLEGPLVVRPEREGTVFPWERVVRTVSDRVRALSREPITLALVQDLPNIRAAETGEARLEAEGVLAASPIELEGKGKSWGVDRKTLASWLVFAKHDGGVTADISPTDVTTFLNGIAPQVEVTAQNARFTIQNGRVAEFQGGTDGVAINREASFSAIRNALLADHKNTAELSFSEKAPDVTTESVNNLGIKELVAVGRTNFSGSPKNRRHNIGVGAKSLNGLLIPPGETFSLIKGLGSIDTAHGYLPELVIKGDRTIPEVGGGLCQIGTTFFRLILNSGLPVLQRQNHSYRVRYYEPPVGMDATIYDPAPDFKFKNDYEGYLLLQAHVEGDDLVFGFWGTKDARMVEMTKPRVYNVVAPGPKKIIETDELKPGETKCVEKPHPGSDAEFTYTVTYPDGAKQSKVFKSHYVPWREVCLVGKRPKAQTE